MNDKRVTKCLIAAAALIVIVAMTPLALAQKPGALIVTVYNRANCDNNPLSPAPKCPAFYNMITGVEIGNKKVTFPAGECDRALALPCKGPTNTYPITVGQHFAIDANMGSQPVCSSGSKAPNCTWHLETPHIVSNPKPAGGQCGDVSANRCEGVMPDVNILNIDVNYHWEKR
ncbi:MAG TPA: hypothetical protein VEH06_17415 [Candidatus Bathyarchaeia archaeon]|nr:hypothetical protein [Candidatus Bathyarchaeia archaeon]